MKPKLVVFSLLLAACSLPRTPITAPAARGSYLQIVAHSDDDLLFMNPDLANTIRAGRPTTTVYLTAGEAWYTRGPDNQTPVDRATCHAASPLSREQYVACRQEGVRAAYAMMAGASAADWKRTQLSVTTTAGPRLIELDSLATDAKQVSLLFVNLPDAADEAEGLDSLQQLLLRSAERRSTIVAAGGVVRASQSYDRETLLQTLTAILQRFNPTVVRIQDTSPDVSYRFVDHPDHIAAARLSAEAFARYSATHARLVSYRDYNINNGQVNLEPAQVADKNAVFRAYAAFDREIKAGDVEYGRWPARLYHRWWGGSHWVARNLDGRLQAFAVLNHNLVSWEQALSGGWQRRNLGSPAKGRLAPWVAVARNGDGRLEVFVLGVDTPVLDRDGVQSFRNDVYSISQTAANGGWSEHWTALGNPGDPGGALDNLGVVSATTNLDGRLQLFVKNASGGVSTKWQTAANGGWSDWLDLGGGPGVQDGLAAITTRAGHIELFAYAIENSRGMIKRWYQPAANGELTADPFFPAFEPAGPPAVATNADGRLDVFYRLASSDAEPRAAQVGHTWQTAAEGGWTSEPEIIAGHGGIGPIATAMAAPTSAGGRIVLFERNRSGGVSRTQQRAANAGYEQPWVDMGGLVPHEPAAATDAAGRVVVFIVDAEGNLLLSKQTGGGGDASFSDWAVAAAGP